METQTQPTYLSRSYFKKLYRREVYRNLHFKDETVYSVRKEGIVEGHALLVVLDGCTLAVGPKGNQRVRDEMRKNVHALIRGYIVNAVWYDEDNMEHAIDACSYHKDCHMQYRDGYEWKKVTYNPYKYTSFVTVEGEEPVFQARKVIIGKTVWAQIPTEEILDKN
jgi:hypothetical protein